MVKIADSNSQEHQIRLVIVGGGYAGSSLMNHLVNFNKTIKSLKHLRITLVDAKTYFETTPAMPHVLAHADHDTFIAQYSDAYGKDSRVELIVPFKLVSIEPSKRQILVRSVQDENEERTISYDILVLAVGSSYRIMKPVVGSQQEATLMGRKAVLDLLAQQLSAASKGNGICVVGGNSTGIEVAAELAAKFDAKKITLVSSGERLMNRLAPAAGALALRQLKAAGVKVIIGDGVPRDITQPKSSQGSNIAIPIEGGKLVTSKGAEIHADLLIPCVGFAGNKEPLDASPELQGSRDETGLLRVNEYLQVDGFANIFAMGDVASTGEEKMALVAHNHATAFVAILEKILPTVVSDPSRLGQVLQDHKSWPKYKKAHEVMNVVQGGSVAFVATESRVMMKGFLIGIIKSFVNKNAVKCMLYPRSLLLIK